MGHLLQDEETIPVYSVNDLRRPAMFMSRRLTYDLIKDHVAEWGISDFVVPIVKVFAYNSCGQVYMIERGSGSNVGEWSCVAGHVQGFRRQSDGRPEEEDLDSAAVREMAEEAGRRIRVVPKHRFQDEVRSAFHEHRLTEEGIARRLEGYAMYLSVRKSDDGFEFPRITRLRTYLVQMNGPWFPPKDGAEVTRYHKLLPDSLANLIMIDKNGKWHDRGSTSGNSFEPFIPFEHDFRVLLPRYNAEGVFSPVPGTEMTGKEHAGLSGEMYRNRERYIPSPDEAPADDM